MTDWQMRRIESTSENPCCALVREVGPYKATIWYVPESQTWGADVMRGERLLVRWGCLPFADAVTFAGEALDTLT